MPFTVAYLTIVVLLARCHEVEMRAIGVPGGVSPHSRDQIRRWFNNAPSQIEGFHQSGDSSFPMTARFYQPESSDQFTPYDQIGRVYVPDNTQSDFSTDSGAFSSPEPFLPDSYQEDNFGAMSNFDQPLLRSAVVPTGTDTTEQNNHNLASGASDQFFTNDGTDADNSSLMDNPSDDNPESIDNIPSKQLDSSFPSAESSSAPGPDQGSLGSTANSGGTVSRSAVVPTNTTEQINTNLPSGASNPLVTTDDRNAEPDNLLLMDNPSNVETESPNDIPSDPSTTQLDSSPSGDLSPQGTDQGSLESNVTVNGAASRSAVTPTNSNSTVTEQNNKNIFASAPSDPTLTTDPAFEAENSSPITNPSNIDSAPGTGPNSSTQFDSSPFANFYPQGTNQDPSLGSTTNPAAQVQPTLSPSGAAPIDSNPAFTTDGSADADSPSLMDNSSASELPDDTPSDPSMQFDSSPSAESSPSISPSGSAQGSLGLTANSPEPTISRSAVPVVPTNIITEKNTNNLISESPNPTFTTDGTSGADQSSLLDNPLNLNDADSLTDDIALDPSMQVDSSPSTEASSASSSQNESLESTVNSAEPTISRSTVTPTEQNINVLTPTTGSSNEGTSEANNNSLLPILNLDATSSTQTTKNKNTQTKSQHSNHPPTNLLSDKDVSPDFGFVNHKNTDGHLRKVTYSVDANGNIVGNFADVIPH